MPASTYVAVSRKALFGVAAAAIAVASMAGTAEAKHKNHFGIVLNFGAPDYGYADPGYNSCRWLKWKAIKTGSSYWWKQYHYCIYG